MGHAPVILPSSVDFIEPPSKEHLGNVKFLDLKDSNESTESKETQGPSSPDTKKATRGSPRSILRTPTYTQIVRGQN